MGRATSRPTALRTFPPETSGTNKAIYDNFDGSVTYGEPKEIALMRASMEFFSRARARGGVIRRRGQRAAVERAAWIGVGVKWF